MSAPAPFPLPRRGPLGLVHAAWAFFVRDLRNEASYRLAFVLQVFGLFVSATLWYFMARFIGAVSRPDDLKAALGGLDYYSFALVGLVVSRFIDVAQSSYGAQIRNEQTTGTLEAMLVTPTRLAHIVLAASTWSFAFATFQGALYLLFGVAVFGVQLNPGSLVGAVAAIVFSALALSGLGILSAAFVLYFKRGNPIEYVVSMGSLLFGNILIPLAALPPGLRWISRLLPVTYAVEAVRGALLLGKDLRQLAPDLAALAAFAVVLVPLGLAGARLAVRQAKKDGSLVQY